MKYEVDILEAPARHLAVTRFSAPPAEIGEQMGRAFGIVMSYAAAHGIHTEGPAVAYYVRKDGSFDVSAGFPVTNPMATDREVVPFDLPAREVARTTHIGGYERLMEAYRELHREVERRGRVLDEDVMWEEYWSGPEVPEAEHRTVVFWPLQPA